MAVACRDTVQFQHYSSLKLVVVAVQSNIIFFPKVITNNNDFTIWFIKRNHPILNFSQSSAHNQLKYYETSDFYCIGHLFLNQVVSHGYITHPQILVSDDLWSPLMTTMASKGWLQTTTIEVYIYLSIHLFSLI